MTTILFNPAVGIPGRQAVIGNQPGRVVSGRVSATQGPTYFGQVVYWDANNELTTEDTGNNFAGIAVEGNPAVTGTTPSTTLATAEASLGTVRAITANTQIGVLTEGFVYVKLAAGQGTPRRGAQAYVRGQNATSAAPLGTIESTTSADNVANTKLSFVSGTPGGIAIVAVNTQA